MKRLLTSAVCLVLFIGAMAQADIKMRVTPKVIAPGTDMVALDFELINPTQEVSAGNMNIFLPEGFSVLEEDDEYLVEMNTERLPSGKGQHEIDGNYQTDGSFKVMFYSSRNKTLEGTSGTLFTLKCSVSSEVATGLLPVTLRNIVLVWGEGSDERFDQEEQPGFIRVKGAETALLTIPEGGFGTLCLPFAAELQTGMKAYKATGIEDNVVVMTEQSTIAANTPLLIEGAPGEYTFTGDNSAATEQTYTAGAMTGMLFPTDMSEGYVLQLQTAGLGFYRLAAQRTIPAYRCILNSAKTQGAPAFLPVVFGDETDAISTISADASTTEAYTLDGKRTSTLQRGQIYIVNGKKSIIK